jgi:hypothetical protein
VINSTRGFDWRGTNVRGSPVPFCSRVRIGSWVLLALLDYFFWGGIASQRMSLGSAVMLFQLFHSTRHEIVNMSTFSLFKSHSQIYNSSAQVQCLRDLKWESVVSSNYLSSQFSLIVQQYYTCSCSNASKSLCGLDGFTRSS